MLNRSSEDGSSNGTSAKQMALYTHFLLQKHTHRLNEEELDAVLDHLLVLFAYLDDKDVFQKFYLKKLALRLLQKTSWSSRLEKSMIAKLKVGFGRSSLSSFPTEGPTLLCPLLAAVLTRSIDAHSVLLLSCACARLCVPLGL
jgi:Cullin family